MIKRRETTLHEAERSGYPEKPHASVDEDGFLSFWFCACQIYICEYVLECSCLGPQTELETVANAKLAVISTVSMVFDRLTDSSHLEPNSLPYFYPAFSLSALENNGKNRNVECGSGCWHVYTTNLCQETMISGRCTIMLGIIKLKRPENV